MREIAGAPFEGSGHAEPLRAHEMGAFETVLSRSTLPVMSQVSHPALPDSEPGLPLYNLILSQLLEQLIGDLFGCFGI